ncbi:GAF domain-containing protein [Actinoplanes sp. NPDC023936]|uniref:GAF domain-containing protein n=1 Tax=Actinoplanes sp. NPDC023936 TaxID=3154910 RepID=UPI0033EF46C6
MTLDAAYRYDDNPVDALLRVDRLSAVAALLPADGAAAGGLREFVEHVARIYEANVAALTAMLDGVVLMSAARGVTDRAGVPVGGAPCTTAVIHDAPVLITDTHDDRRYSGDPLVMASGMRSYVGVPLPLANRAVGTLCVMDQHRGAFNEEDLRALQSLAAHAVRLLHATRHGG